MKVLYMMERLANKESNATYASTNQKSDDRAIRTDTRNYSFYIVLSDLLSLRSYFIHIPCFFIERGRDHFPKSLRRIAIL